LSVHAPDFDEMAEQVKTARAELLAIVGGHPPRPAGA
jgi:hypothetical protein